MKFTLKKQRLKEAIIAGLLAAFLNTPVFAAGEAKPSELNNSLAIVLLSVIVVLLLAIGLLANVMLGAAELFVKRFKEKQQHISDAGKIAVFIAFSLFTSAAFAADAPAADAAKEVVTTTIGGLSKTSFYGLLAVIAVELAVLFTLLFQLKIFLAKEKPVVVEEEVVAKESAFVRIWRKMNSFKPEHEVVDTGHDYDGIRELDNNLPKWWLYGFYVCIVFALVYVYRFHIAHSAPSSIQEYEIAVAKAAVEKDEYLKTAASKVDENSVTLLTDATSLGEGQKLFASSCSPCHGASGQGVVGPNLTDDYWLHKGGVKDVFKTIKYGVQEKGMKSWKDDFSPVQIAELASYIKSLHGTKPAGAKEPQGELFKEDAASASDKNKNADTKIAAN